MKVRTSKSRRAIGQAVVVTVRAGGGKRVQLEVARRGAKYRTVGALPAEAAAIHLDAAPIGVLLDWLEDNADRVRGLDARTVRQAAAAVRSRGNWFVH